MKTRFKCLVDNKFVIWIISVILTFSLTEEEIKLPKIGISNTKARPSKVKRLTAEEYFKIPASFLAFLAGVIDGDGHIWINESKKGSINLNLSISLHIEDLSLLTYIQSILNLGTIYSYPSRTTCRLVINKTELQEVLFPLLLHHNIHFLTTQRTAQFNMAMYILKENIKSYSCLPANPPAAYELPKDAQGYVNLHFFTNWIVGFVVAEGSFFIKSNNDGCFQIKQKMHFELFEAFKIVFNTNRKVTIDRLGNSQFGVSSKADVQTVINFFSFSGLHPLVGVKLISYTKWIADLSKSTRYKDLKFPN